MRARPTRAGADPDSVEVFWLGHATALVRLGDRWVLTDPVFSTRIGGLVRRYVRPGARVSDLPAVDWVLISHAHADHLDPASLRAMPASATLVAPPGARSDIPATAGPTDVRTLDAWKSTERDGMRVTAVPARHADGRWWLDGAYKRHGHTGYVIEYGAHTVYFAGDTGYDPHVFREIGERFDIDVALIPVGPAARPAWLHALRKHVHASPAEAMTIFADVGAQWMVPVHFGTFFTRSEAETREIRAAVAHHPRGRFVRLLPIGGSTAFYY